jgi:hypothetical protein
VACSNVVALKIGCSLHEKAELDPPITDDAGVGRAPNHVGCGENLDNLSSKFLSQIKDVERNTKSVCHRAGIIGN